MLEIRTTTRQNFLLLKGKVARFEFGEVSTAIDNDRSLFRLIDHAARFAPA
jgi:hypothetical protein